MTWHATAGAAASQRSLSLKTLPRLECLQELHVNARLELGQDLAAKLLCQVRQAITVSFRLRCQWQITCLWDLRGMASL